MNSEAYGELLARRRVECRLSQTEAGKRLGMARETLSLWERGKFSYPPRLELMLLVEQLYGVPMFAQLWALGYPMGPPDHTPLELEALALLRAMPESNQGTALAMLRLLRDGS